ncbi:hypothetical protein ACWDKQ_09450 [Saccharopolyspora sp. NPDC000995]
MRLDGAIDATALRRSVAVVDAPDITGPDGALVLRGVVAEGLTLAGRRCGRRHVRDWLSARNWLPEGASEERFENLAGFERTRLLSELACEARAVKALVLDCPDRHGGDSTGWYSIALRHAERGLAVVALCAPHSADKLGVSPAKVGANNPEPSTSDFTEGL